MATQNQFDNEPFVVKPKLRQALTKTRKKFPHTREDYGHSVILKMCGRLIANAAKPKHERKLYGELLHLAIREANIFGDSTRGYKSLISHYKNLGGFDKVHLAAARKDRQKKVLATQQTDYSFLTEELVAVEAQEMAEARGEHIIDAEGHDQNWCEQPKAGERDDEGAT